MNPNVYHPVFSLLMCFGIVYCFIVIIKNFERYITKYKAKGMYTNEVYECIEKIKAFQKSGKWMKSLMLYACFYTVLTFLAFKGNEVMALLIPPCLFAIGYCYAIGVRQATREALYNSVAILIVSLCIAESLLWFFVYIAVLTLINFLVFVYSAHKQSVEIFGEKLGSKISFEGYTDDIDERHRKD